MKRPVFSVLVALATVAGIPYPAMLEMPAHDANLARMRRCTSAARADGWIDEFVDRMTETAEELRELQNKAGHHTTVAGYRRPGVLVGDVAALLEEAVLEMPATARVKDSF